MESDFKELKDKSVDQSNDIESGINRDRTEDGEYESTQGKSND